MPRAGKDALLFVPQEVPLPSILPPVPDQPPHNALVLFGPTPAQLTWIVGTLHHDLELIAQTLATIVHTQENQTMASDALTQAVTDLKTEVATHATKVQTQLDQLIAAQANGDQAAIDAAAQGIRDSVTALQGLDVNLDADDAPVVTP